MTNLAKETESKTANSRFFGDTRIVVDLFGPIIDIDKIDLFRGTNARFASEEAIARHHRLPPYPGEDGWTGQRVLEIVKACLQDPKVALTLIDEDIVKDLCLATSFSTVSIVSSVSDHDIFEAAKVVVKKYVASRFEGAVINDSQFAHYPKKDGSESWGVEAFLREHSKEPKFTIVVDDSPAYHLTDDDDLKRGEHFDIWLHGQMGGERLHRDLATIIDARRRIADANSIVRDLADSVRLDEYCAIPGYLVYDKVRSDNLRLQVESIGALLSAEHQGPPICVLLSGPPGSGKSYFVDMCAIDMCAKGLKVPSDYPLASLSGVREGTFDQAVFEHIDQVFNHDGADDPTFAFLDEVDTVPGRSPVAFRLLMNAMTGKRMTELGLSMKGTKSGSASRLVWFFAASGGAHSGRDRVSFCPGRLENARLLGPHSFQS